MNNTGEESTNCVGAILYDRESETVRQYVVAKL